MRLTVAIPTFNRNKILRSNVMKLVPQLTKDCELLILDNCSPEHVERSLEDVFRLLPSYVKVRVIRNRENFGGNENILRCIEYADGDFVWLLGDDDAPIISCIENIMYELENNSDLRVLNMNSLSTEHLVREHTRVLTGSEEYLEYFKSLGEPIFISNLILNARMAKGVLREAYQWQSSCAGQLIVQVMMLRNNGKSVISELSVVDDIGSARTNDNYIDNNLIAIGLGVPTLLYAPWTLSEAYLIRKLISNFWYPSIIIKLIRHFVHSVYLNKEKRYEIVWQYKLLCRSAGVALVKFRFVYILLLLSWLPIRFPSIGVKLDTFAVAMLRMSRRYFRFFG